MAPLTELTDAQRSQALARHAILRIHLDDGVPLTVLSREHGIPLRTLERWRRRYRADGLAGLARRPRSDRGHRQLPDQVVQLIEGLALGRPRPSVAVIHRQVLTIVERDGWPAPSYSTVYDIVRSIDPALVSLAHDGAKVYRERFDLLYRRTAAEPNAIWQADHTQLDVWVRDEHNQPVKPWLTVILDDYSRAVAGVTA